LPLPDARRKSMAVFNSRSTGKWDFLTEIGSVLSSDCRKMPFKDAALCIGH